MLKVKILKLIVTKKKKCLHGYSEKLSYELIHQNLIKPNATPKTWLSYRWTYNRNLMDKLAQ